MNPIKITARCRTVTPMLSSGADQSKFEIRAAEVKAGLRFWWRAFHCGEFQRAMDEEKGKIPGKERIRSESYWKVPTYLDCRLIDLDFKERTTKGETKDALDPKNVISAPESLELLFLRRIVAEARNRLHR